MATTYLDHAAATPLRDGARRAWESAADLVGNPSSLHASGRRARALVEESRERLAAALGARPAEVVWTSGGTEADNLALQGLYRARRAQEPERVRVLIAATEHHAVLDSARWLAQHAGADLVTLPVDDEGTVRVDVLADELARAGGATALVSVMQANNEVGTLQPLEEVVALAHRYGVSVHCDAVQGVGQLDVRLGELDALSVSGHKAGGPVGVGALLVRRGTALWPVLHGGGQERGLRPGTVAAALVAACAAAVAEASEQRPAAAARLAGLRDDLVGRVRAAVPGAVLRGSADPARRLPGNAHLTFAGCDGEALLFGLDQAGVEASTGSACQAGVPQPSHVLLAMGLDERTARGALRFSLGHTSTPADVDRLVEVLPGVVERARAFAEVSS